MKINTNFDIENIIRSKRKSVTIAVLPTGKLEIKAPKRITNKQIEQIILKHTLWITKRIKTLQENKYEQKQFAEGEKLLLLGDEYFLKFENGVKHPEIKDNNIIIDNNNHENLQIFFVFWYKKFALDIFKERALIFAPQLGVEYKKIKVSNAKTRWGSCSSLGNINISWRLIMSPMKVIDYVIVHELAHLLEPNHSHRFWNQVQKILPDYKNQKLWLKKNGHLLSLD